jgi:NTE family protein
MQKTALVLSAGGMFGAYQAGAYKAIADLAPPDLVVGTSVGALNGWAIAGGCTPDELIARWLDSSAGETLRLIPRRGLPARLDPAALQRQSESLCRDYQPRIPFGVVLSLLPLFRPTLMLYPDVDARHLRATCSLPLFLPAVAIDNRRYMDGGLLEKLPLWAALEMGATRIIAVDSMPALPEWWMRAGRYASRIMKPPRQYPASLDLTVISPSETLGSAADGAVWKLANVNRWVELGTRDAARQLGTRDFSPVPALKRH